MHFVMLFLKGPNFSNLNKHLFSGPMLAMFLLAGCGASHQFSSIRNTGPAPKPLLVALSGRSTCDDSGVEGVPAGPAGNKLYKKALIAAVKMEQVFGVRPSIITTCYTGNSELMESASASQWVVTTPTEDEFYLDTQAQMAEATHVYVIGHSYGGWLAMKLVGDHSNFDSSSDSNTVKALFTIDPISKTLCTFSTPRGCFSAPGDLTTLDRNRIKNTTEIWVNPWQDATLYLHSSSISEADRNPKFDLAHNTILESEVVWSDFSDQFQL